MMRCVAGSRADITNSFSTSHRRDRCSSLRQSASDHPMTLDRSFSMNRLWPIIYLTGLLFVILICAFIALGLGVEALVGFATELPRRIAQSVMSMFAAILFGASVLYLCALAESVFTTLR